MNGGKRVAAFTHAARLARLHLPVSALAILLIAGCADRAPTIGRNDTQNSEWNGRLALTVQSEPAQHFSASFVLRGTSDAGELTLVSPLGTTIAVLQWQPGQALLRQGETVRQYPSVEALAEQVTGAPIPLWALFGWLRGEAQAVEGWTADLGRAADGRITARRLMPLPTAELRIVLDR